MFSLDFPQTMLMFIYMFRPTLIFLGAGGGGERKYSCSLGSLALSSDTCSKFGILEIRTKCEMLEACYEKNDSLFTVVAKLFFQCKN